jgi:hypothetical protein
MTQRQDAIAKAKDLVLVLSNPASTKNEILTVQRIGNLAIDSLFPDLEMQPVFPRGEQWNQQTQRWEPIPEPRP